MMTTSSISTRHADDSHLLPPPVAPTQEIGWWGMALVCATEGAFFAYLLTSYFYLALRSPAWPPPGIDAPSLRIPSIMTVLLVSSSATMYWGEHGIKQGRHWQLRAGASVTLLLGLLFLWLQMREYHEKLRHFVPQTNAYGSIFYTTTSFHGMHVAFGLLLIAFLVIRELFGHFSVHSHLAVKVTSLYWHFVDAVWLFIFTSLYLSPHWYTHWYSR